MNFISGVLHSVILRAIVFAVIGSLILVTIPKTAYGIVSLSASGNDECGPLFMSEHLLLGSINSLTPPPCDTSATVDFRTRSHKLSIDSVGSTISTYSGGGAGNINLSKLWKDQLKELGPMSWRVPLRYNDGNPGSSASGGQSKGDGKTYIKNIKSIGGEPIIVVGGNSSDNDFTAEDAAGLVSYFNEDGGMNGGPVKQWIIGNEYTKPGNDPMDYQARLNKVAAAMKSVDPEIKISAPAAPDMMFADKPFKDTIEHAGEYIDYLGYHGYQGRTFGLSRTSHYAKSARKYREKFINREHFGDRADEIKVSLEEFNWHPYYEGNSEFYSWENAVFTASVVGHSLSENARAIHYSDSNGPLGLMNDGSYQHDQPGQFTTRFPAYWGLAMWTGLNGKFKRFGSYMVKAKSDVNNVEIYATDNGKIIAINTESSKPKKIDIGLGGVAGNGLYSVWQTSKDKPFAYPEKVLEAEKYQNAIISVDLPAGSISSIELQ